MIKSFSRKKMLFVIIAVLVAVCILYINQEEKIPVLNYHQIEDGVNNPLTLRCEDFEAQMEYLHNHGYNSITPDQLVAHIENGSPLPDKPILITLDDGYRDNYTNAYPIMKKYGFTGTIFLITDFVGHNERYLDWGQIKEMQQGGFTFGSHTLNHVPLTTVTHDEALKQLIKSKEGIEWRLNTPVKYFAYPGGYYNKDIEKLLEESGYSAAFSVDFGRVSIKSDRYALERIPIFRYRHPFYDFYLRLNFTFIANQIKMIIRPIWHVIHSLS